MNDINKKTLFPLSRSQQEILSLETELFTNTNINVQAVAVYLSSCYSDLVIEEVINLITKQEQALRLKMVHTEEGWFQEEVPYSFFPVPSAFCEDMEGDTFFRFLQKECLVSMSCSDYPLCRFAIYRSAGETAVTVIGHHVIFDSWSFLLLAHQLEEFCRLLCLGQEIHPDSHSFTETCLAEQKLLQSGRRNMALDYWTGQYMDPPGLCRLLPEKPYSEIPDGGRIELTLTRKTEAAVHDFCSRRGISPATLFQTAIAMWLYVKNPGADRIDFSQMTLGRTCLEEKQMLGNFALESMICAKITPDMTIEGLIKVIQRAVLEAFYHGLLSHDEILELARKQKPEITVIRDIEFGYVPYNQMYEHEPDVDWLTEEEPETSAEYLVYHSRSHGITIFFHYRTAVFTEKEAKLVFDGILDMLDICIQRTEEPLNIIEDLREQYDNCNIR